MVLDQLMVDLWNNRKPLRWRQHACFNEAGAVLYKDCPGYLDKVPPDLVIRAKPLPNWKSHGVSDYFQTAEAKWLSSLITKTWMKEQWMDGVAFDAHASCEMGYHRETASKAVAERWDKGLDFVEVPLGIPELRPAPGMAETSAAWSAALRSGRATSEEDNLAALGLGNREVALLGGYDNIVKELPPEKQCRLRPLYPRCDKNLGYAVDANVLAALHMFKAEHKSFGLSRSDMPTARTVVVVAATHGSGISRLARRFRQGTAMRFDRLAAAQLGELAYNRNYDGSLPTEQSIRQCARAVGRSLKTGHNPDLRVLLTHEHPNIIADSLKSAGLNSYWYLYTVSDTERDTRVEARAVEPDVLRYMKTTWNRLYRLAGNTDELRSEEDVIQMARAIVA
jgi:hypothetical protein